MYLFKRFIKVFGLILFVVIIVLGFVIYPLLKGATGYSAKMMCSGVFVEGMSQQEVESRELSAFPFNKVVSKLDRSAQVVKSTIFGIVSQRAVYTDGRGATLYPNGTDKKTLCNTYPKLDNSELPWPMGSVVADSIPVGVDMIGLNAFIEQQFKETSRAVVVVKDGQLIAEKYAESIHQNTPLLGWSMTKSITAALVGILVKEGKLNLDQGVDIAEWKADERAYITFNNLLQMSSGLDWNEDYSRTQLTDVSRMLYIEDDVFEFASSAKAFIKPDSLWYYSSGTTNIISGILRSCFDDYQDYYQFPQRALFSKLGMTHSLIETDAVGNFVGSSYGYCSARDWARFGMLYLNNGNWLGEQILPEWWVEYSTLPARQSDGKYGAQLWLNASRINIPDMPADTYFMNGYRGQRVTIIPSKKMVVVCLNSTPDALDYNMYLSKIMKFVK